MWWLMTAAAHTRWLLNAVWAFVWSLGYAVLTFIPLGVHGYRWWLGIIGSALLMGVAVGALAAWLDRRTAASYAAVLDGLTPGQRRQVTRIWRRGPVPTDPMVLTAALRLHDLGEHYERRRQYNGKTAVVLVILAMAIVVTSLIGSHHDVPVTGLALLAIGVYYLAAPTMIARRARRRQPRLDLLRAAAQADPQVAAAVARPAEPAPPPPVRQRVIWAVLVLAVVGIAMVTYQIAITKSPHRAGCRAVDAVVSEVYQGSDYLLAEDTVQPDGPPLSQYQQWAESMRRHAADADGDPATAPHLDRVADLAAQAVTVIEQARQPGQSASSLADSQNTHRGIMAQLVDEDGLAQDQCRH